MLAVGSEDVSALCLLCGGEELALFPHCNRQARVEHAQGQGLALQPALLVFFIAVSHAHSSGSPCGVMDPKTTQRAPLKPKACCASPSSCAASLLLHPSCEGSQVKTQLKGSEDQACFSQASSRISPCQPPFCAQPQLSLAPPSISQCASMASVSGLCRATLPLLPGSLPTSGASLVWPGASS